VKSGRAFIGANCLSVALADEITLPECVHRRAPFVLTDVLDQARLNGHLQRGGIPSAADRLIATRPGTACVDMIDQRTFGVMVATRGDGTKAVMLEDVAGKVKTVPPDHPWVLSARHVGISLGD
jgi:ATP-dependent phosphofructokinase / diphosphate-dependent phosphofructokinase